MQKVKLSDLKKPQNVVEVARNSWLIQINEWLIGGLGWWFGILGVPVSNNPFHFRGSQESKPPTHKPPIYH